MAKKALARASLIMLVMYGTLGQRVTIELATGGRGVVAPLALIFIVLASLTAVMWLGTARKEVNRPVLSPVTIGPLLTLMVILPLLAVVIGTYPFRTIGAIVPGLIPVASLVTTRASILSNLNVKLAGQMMIVLHGTYGLLQYLRRLDLLPANISAQILSWDVTTQSTYSDAYVIVGRSTGMFINPNEYGVWSVLAAIFSVAAFRGRTRAFLLFLSVVGIVTSQSRTALLASIVVLAFWTTSLMRRKHFLAKMPIVLSAAALFGAFLFLSGLLPGLLEDASVSRIASGLSVINNGYSADANLLGRVNAWQLAAEFSRDSRFPFGTLGPPTVFFPSYIDNQYVALYLQGSFFMLGAFGLALLSPWVMRKKQFPGTGTLALMSLVVATTSITATIVHSAQPLVLIWLWAGVITMVPIRSERVFDKLTTDEPLLSVISQLRKPVGINPPE